MVRHRPVADVALSLHLGDERIGMEDVAVDPGDRTLHGECLCGGVEYVVRDAFQYALNCHCSQCRRTTGSAFKPLAGIPRADLRIVRGSDATMTYGEGEAHDVHCRTCGSLLFSVVRGGTYVHVPMGTLKDEPTIKPSMHIFVGSKAPWYQITDDLPQHDALPDD